MGDLRIILIHGPGLEANYLYSTSISTDNYSAGKFRAFADDYFVFLEPLPGGKPNVDLKEVS